MAANKAHEEIIDFIAGCNPRSIIQFRPSDEAKARVWDLVARSKINSLSEEESSELDDYLMLEHIMRLAKARATQQLASETRP